MDEDRLAQLMPCLELRQQLVEIMDVPHTVDLRQHHHIEFATDGTDNFDQVVEHPGRVQRIDANPESGRSITMRPRHGDEARPCGDLSLSGDRVFQVAEHHVDLRDQVSDLVADLVDVRWYEVDHAFEPHRQHRQRMGRTESERFEEFARRFHESGRSLRGGEVATTRPYRVGRKQVRIPSRQRQRALRGER